MNKEQHPTAKQHRKQKLGERVIHDELELRIAGLCEPALKPRHVLRALRKQPRQPGERGIRTFGQRFLP